jgi:hypothetical protein
MPDSLPCINCHGTGRDTREAARLVLDAEPRRARYGERGDHHRPSTTAEGWADPWVSGEALARDHLSVLADRLQGEGYGEAEKRREVIDVTQAVPGIVHHPSTQAWWDEGWTVTQIDQYEVLPPGEAPRPGPRTIVWRHVFELTKPESPLRGLGLWLSLWLSADADDSSWVPEAEAALDRIEP